MFAHAQVVRPGGMRQLDRFIVHQRIVGVDHAIVEVGRLLTEVKEHHLLAVLIDLEVRADAPVAQAAGPVGVRAQCFQRDWVHAIRLAALAHGGQSAATVYFDVGAGVVFHSADGSPATAHGPARFDDARPQ